MNSTDNSLLAIVKQFIEAEEHLNRLKQNKLKNKISMLEKEVYEAQQENLRLQNLIAKKKKRFWIF